MVPFLAHPAHCITCRFYDPRHTTMLAGAWATNIARDEKKHAKYPRRRDWPTTSVARQSNA